MDRLAQWSAQSTPGQSAGSPSDQSAAPDPTPKPQFVFIECSDQRISPLGRCPTPDEVEEEITLALSKGARGIIYFPQRPPPGFQYDAMPPEIVERITAINHRLNQQFNQPQSPPTEPPAQNEPTNLELLTALESLRGEMGNFTQHLQSLSQQVTALTQRTFRASFDLQSVDPSFSSPGTPGEGREGVRT